ncbi:hypothetical protein AXF42_Ash021738 [Apostasia shenzhenica]|uniref:Uncharacterized protein n=1 Tax=Apostasia shenzhenica TaxID=1088818 RepID=A0A2H9ZRC2_9ASPA|nr:hypothetical protein AXF42_Ash021738 [Apostasia shenzhenica]
MILSHIVVLLLLHHTQRVSAWENVDVNDQILHQLLHAALQSSPMRSAIMYYIVDRGQRMSLGLPIHREVWQIEATVTTFTTLTRWRDHVMKAVIITSPDGSVTYSNWISPHNPLA